MNYRVVCISRAAGAGGEQVGRLVAERLGFRYFDDEVIALASEKAGIDSAVVASAEHQSSLLSRLLDALVRPPMRMESYLTWRDSGEYYSREVLPSVDPPKEQLRRLIQEAIVEIAQRGSAVIVAHAASMALAGQRDVLRVLVTAPATTREHRLWLVNRLLPEEDYARAVAESDRERARYLERFFDIREESSIHYDLVINTEKLLIRQAVETIVTTVTA